MSILCIYNGRVVPNAASCRLALDCASCTIAPYVMSAHPRTSKYLPYVSKYTTKADPANLHFKNLWAWCDDRFGCWSVMYNSKSLRCMLLPVGCRFIIYNTKSQRSIWQSVGYRLAVYLNTHKTIMLVTICILLTSKLIVHHTRRSDFWIVYCQPVTYRSLHQAQRFLKCSEEVADCIGNFKTYGECLETLRWAYTT